MLLVTTVAHGQETPPGAPVPGDAEEPVHWALASVVGTGWYQVAGGRDAFIISLSPRQVLRETLRERETRQNGLWINYDAAVGLYDIDVVPGVVSPDNLGTVSFTPGIEAEYPLSERWTLRGYANLGWGTATGDGNSAWIWYTGLKSRYRLGPEESNWSLLNGLYYAGFNPETGATEGITGLFTGVEFAHALERGSAWRLHWHLAYTVLEDSVAFVLREDTTRSVGNTAELGLAVSRRNDPFKIWFVEFDRLGLKYSIDSHGEFKSISLTVGSWFDS